MKNEWSQMVWVVNLIEIMLTGSRDDVDDEAYGFVG